MFLGGWHGPSFLPDEIWFLIKAYIVFTVFMWLTWSVPRIRIDQMLVFGWRRLLPLAVLNLLIAAVLKSGGWF